MTQNIRAGPGTENSQHQNFPKYKKQTKGKNNNPQITEQNKSMMLKNIGENKLWAPAFGSTWNKPDFPEKILLYWNILYQVPPIVKVYTYYFDIVVRLSQQMLISLLKPWPSVLT